MFNLTLRLCQAFHWKSISTGTLCCHGQHSLFYSAIFPNSFRSFLSVSCVSLSLHNSSGLILDFYCILFVFRPLQISIGRAGLQMYDSQLLPNLKIYQAHLKVVQHTFGCSCTVPTVLMIK